jgi:membrane protease subunit HflC
MIKRPGVLVIAAVIVLLFLLVQLFFMVHEGEVAVRTFLGKPVRAYTESGLYMCWPRPLERVYTFDNRLHTLETSYDQTLTQDGKSMLVGMYAAWRIAEPIKFLESVGSAEQAELLLDGLIRNHMSATIGRHPFSALVNVDPDALQFGAIEASILERVAPDALARYGIALTTIGIHRLGLPEDITESVFARMRAEREKLAEQYRSEGLGEATSIRAEADSRKEQLLSKARADAKRIRARGDAEAADFFRVFEEDPELAMFLRRLETTEQLLREKSTVVLSLDTEPFRVLKGEDPAIPAGEGTR